MPTSGRGVLTVALWILATGLAAAEPDLRAAIAEQRALLNAQDDHPDARQRLAEIGWQLAAGIEHAESVEETAHADQLQADIERLLPDIVWRTQYYADKKDVAAAQLAQAVLLRTGTLVPANASKACDYYRKAAAAGLAAANWQYSRCLQAVDKDAALMLARKAATAGHAQAMQFVAELGLTSKDAATREEAVTLLKRSAQAGRASAKLLLGALYETGTVVAADLDSAARYYLESAADGHKVAQNNLGALYQRQGRLDEAEQWYQKAAASELPIAQLNLGLLLAQREQDDCAAVDWIRRAADTGLELAGRVLADPQAYQIQCPVPADADGGAQ